MTKRVTRQIEGEPRFVTRRIGGETLIVPIAGGVGDLESIYTLNEIATRIWDALDTPRSADEIAAILAADYDENESTLMAHVVEFIDTLESAGLARAVPESEGR
jgi:hypothetical protein